MSEGKEGYQPSEEEVKDAESHMTEKEAVMSEVRDETNEFSKTGKSNVSEKYWERGPGVKEDRDRYLTEIGGDISENIKNLVSGDESRKSKQLQDPNRLREVQYDFSDMTKYGRPEREDFLTMLAAKAGLSNTDLDKNILGEKDGWLIEFRERGRSNVHLLYTSISRAEETKMAAGYMTEEEASKSKDRENSVRM